MCIGRHYGIYLCGLCKAVGDISAFKQLVQFLPLVFLDCIVRLRLTSRNVVPYLVSNVKILYILALDKFRVNEVVEIMIVGEIEACIEFRFDGKAVA